MNIQALYSSSKREEALNYIKDVLETDGFEPFIYNITTLFRGLQVCLEDSNVDNLLICYQVLIGSLPEILKDNDIEVEFIKLLPAMIENLGSQKTVVRKSTHRWIASYVKLSLKLERVLTYIINVGLVHSKHRTRQHSMLVIPALLSLKKSWVKGKSKEIVELVNTVAMKLFDTSEIVQKTAKKLLVELKRVYPTELPSIIDMVSARKLRNWCRAILEYELESESDEEPEEGEVQMPVIEQKPKDPVISKELPSSGMRPVFKEPQVEEIRKPQARRSPEKIRKSGKFEAHRSRDKPDNSNEMFKKSKNTFDTQAQEIYDQPKQTKVNKHVKKEETHSVKKAAPTATKSKPFRIRETPKKNATVAKSRASHPYENDSLKQSHDNLLPSKLNFGSERDETLSMNYSHHGRQEAKPLSNTQLFDKSTKKDNFSMNSSSKSDKDEVYSQQVTKKSTKVSSGQTSKPPITSSLSQSSLGNPNGRIDFTNQGKSKMIEMEREQMKSVSVAATKKHETIGAEPQTVKPLLSKHRSQDSHHESKSVNQKFEMNTIKPKLQNRAPIKTELEDSSDTEEEKSVRKITSIKVKESSSEESDQSEGEQEDSEQEDSDGDELPISLNGMVFSFIPPEIANSLTNEDAKKRTFAVQEVETLIKKQFVQPGEDFSIYIPDIWKTMCKLMNDSNFKISLTALRILNNLWVKYPTEVMDSLSLLVSHLLNKFSDNKMVIRHAVLKVFYSLVITLGSKKIVNLVYPKLNHDNWRIREEILNVLIMACITSNSTCGLSDPKSLNSICQLISDEKKEVSTAAFEILCWILSKDSSTAIILNSYLDPQLYNLISERWLSGMIATVNYDGIVEFPTSQKPNNQMSYNASYLHSQESESMQDPDEGLKHMNSADHTYTSNFQSSSNINRMNDNQYALHTQPGVDFNKTNSTTQSIGNKMWLPGFNMTASSIKSEQSVRVSQEPYHQTPNQYKKDAIERRQDRAAVSNYDIKSNYTPEVHQSKPRTFGSVNNPSMTTHSMNSAPSQTNTINNHTTDATRSNTFYSRGSGSAYSYHGNQNISDKLKILKSSSKMKSSHVTRSPISQPDVYNDEGSSKGIPSMAGFNHQNMRRSQADQYESKSKIDSNEQLISGHGPVKAREIPGMGGGSASKAETISASINDMDNDSNDGKHYRYSQSSNKSLESRNRNKGSFHHKPPMKGKKLKGEIAERPLSIDARDDDTITEKVKSPEQVWKQVLSDISKKNNWEKQFQACNTIKDYSIEHPKFFSPHDSHYVEIMQELAKLCNSLRTQLSRNALGTFAIVFENLGKRVDSILDTIIPMLLKKAADTNAFIAEEAEKSLIKACENCSESKIVAAALSMSKTKTNSVKEKILVAINTIVEKLQEKIKSFKDRERIVGFLAQGMNEAALEVRNAAKSGFMILKSCLPESDFERLVLRSTSDRDYSKVLDFLEKESTQSDRFMITNGISTKGTFYYNKTRMSKMSKQTSESNDYGDLEPHFQPPSSSKKIGSSHSGSAYKKSSIGSTGHSTSSNFEVIDSTIMTKFEDIIKMFDETDWKKRVAGLKSLSNFIQEEDKLIKKSKKFFAIIDVFVKCLKDNNSKVVIATQDIFSNLIPNIKKMIEKGSHQIIEALASNVVSSNTLIKNCGEALMKKLVLSDDLECSVFIQPMWNQIIQGNSRCKTTILIVLSEVVEIVYEIKPVVVTRYVYNLCSKLIDDKKIKGDTKKALSNLVEKWYELGGDSFVNSFPSRNSDKIWTILKSDTSAF